ncbi:MAG: hypothetical protein HYZ47_05085, partial [Simkania negevensis]|nr:hypothetical protein [Simkania negevensis]
MLNFFRKYQKSFLVFIAIIIGISFSFFGTQYTLNAPRKIEDKKIGKAIDGSSMMQGEIAEIIRFIATDSYEIEMGGRKGSFNLFNDGFIAKDIFSTGVGGLLAETYFDELKVELLERFERNKKYHPYTHPSAPFISLNYLWSQALPNQKKKLDHFFNEVREMTPETFALLVDLYLGERGLPPSILRQYLLLWQNQYEWITPDPGLKTVSLNLFNCHCIEDWFGPKFLQLIAQFLHNMALLAREKGYSVSKEEARADLLQNGKRSLQMQTRGKEINAGEVEETFSDLLRSLSLSEEEAIGVWRKVLLFRRLFDQVGKAVFVDPDLYQNFYQYATKGAKIELYHLPEELHLKDFSSFLQFETYLSLTAGDKEHKDLHTLPTLSLPISTIEKKAPSLLERRFLVEMSRIDLSELAREISLKEMWQWQLKEENFLLLEKEFPSLAASKGKEDSFYLCLERLDASFRQKVDRFSRLKILLSQPQIIQQALQEANKKRELLRINGEYKSLSHPDLEEVEKLYFLLIKASLLKENDEQSEANKALEFFYDGEKAAYCFHLIDREREKRL